jgi:hypothetical protein
MVGYEQCRENLEILIKESELIDINSLNEANTRFKFIDRLLTECLGWETNDISCEDNYEGKYTDYILSLFRSVAVLEAKRTGVYFELPIGNKKHILPLKSIYKDNKDIKAAIDQVRGYCNDRSIQIAIISNGFQFVAFVANRSDSVPVLDGNALVVESLSVFLNEFKEVWNCLSKTGFQEEYLLKKLIGNTELELPPKLSSTIFGYPGIKNRNTFQTELEIISDLVLEDVIKEKELEKDFLENCYCKSGALSNYSLVSKAILSTRYNYLFEIGDRKATLQQVATKKGLSGELVELFANSLSKRPVLLVGDVGVGKSTFIDYLRLIEAPKVFEKAISFKIDLGLRAIIDLDIRKAIIDVIKEQLSELYHIDIEEDNFVRHCYHVDLEKFKKSVKVARLYEIDNEQAISKEIDFLSEKIENKIEHLKRSLEYICKHQQKQIITFVDNCDQRSDSDQETAFLVAQEFASEWPMIVFISIRPETFHRTKKDTGALSGYHTKAFTIPPPRLDDVIRKRLEFAQKITNGDIQLSRLSNKTSFTKLNDLIEVFVISLDRNPALLTFLNNISNENIRNAVQLIKKFFGSGHVDMEKILDIYYTQGHYTIPLHELLRSVIFSDNIHFAPTNSEIVNLFECRHHNDNEYFIILFLVSILDDYSKNSRNDGFVSISEIYSYLQGLGYTSTQIDSVLNFAYSKKLFETSHKGGSLDFNNIGLKIRATNLAIYHLRFLVNSFTYVDAIIVDTPIFNKDIQAQIVNNMEIYGRIERVEIFKNYLDSIWDEKKMNSNHFNWPKISNELKIDIDKIKGKLAEKEERKELNK